MLSEQQSYRRSIRLTPARMPVRVGGAIILALIMASPSLAQLNTQHVKGSVGLKAGSQPPPGGYVVAPLLTSTTPTR